MNKNRVALIGLLLAIGLLGYFVTRPTPPPDKPQVVAQFNGPPTQPDEVEALPEGANFGYSPDAESTKEFLQALPGGKQTLREQAPELFVGDSGEDVMLYRALYIAYEQRYPGEKWVSGSQGIGDCVSWGWAHGADVHLAVLHKLGLSGEWRPAATEAIYGGSRVEALNRKAGGWGDGSYGSAAAKWVKNYGIVFRENYKNVASDECDLTKYDKNRAKQWGNYGAGGKDDRGRLDQVAKKHAIKTVALVTTFDEAAVAIRNGYPIPVCSGQGFSSTRDSQGFAAARGSWAHCMCATAVRGGKRPGVLIQNSWGPRWINGPKWPADQPDGSFWCDKAVFERMLSGRDSFAVSGYEGFPRRQLKNSAGW